jgi:cytochrome bd-type quinol oxidase subunit 2
MPITLKHAKKRLALVWLSGAGVSFALLLFISTQGDPVTVNVPKLWNWFLPGVLPNLSLIVSVLALDLRKKSSEDESIDPFFYRIAFWLSLLYVALFCLLPLLPHPGRDFQQVLDSSQLWLAPVQALATAALGAFFVKRDGK